MAYEMCWNGLLCWDLYSQHGFGGSSGVGVSVGVGTQENWDRPKLISTVCVPITVDTPLVMFEIYVH